MNYKFLLAGTAWLSLTSALSGECPVIRSGSISTSWWIYLGDASPINWSNCNIAPLGAGTLTIDKHTDALNSLKKGIFTNTQFKQVRFAIYSTDETIDLSEAELKDASFIDTDLSHVSFGKNITELPVKSFKGSIIKNYKGKYVKCLDDQCQVGYNTSIAPNTKAALLFQANRPTKPLVDLFKTIKLKDYACSNKARDSKGNYDPDAGDFEGVDLSLVDFSGIYLVGTNFTGAKLDNTIWQGAVIVGAEGDTQWLPPINPAGASLRGADFRGVLFDTGFPTEDYKSTKTKPLETWRLLLILSGAADLTNVVLPDSTLCVDTKCTERLTLTSTPPSCAQGQGPEIRLFTDGETLYTGRCIGVPIPPKQIPTIPEKPSTPGQPPSTQTTLRIMQKQTEVALQNFDNTCTSKAPCTVVYEESPALNSAYETLKKQLDFVDTITRTPINRTTTTGKGRGKRTVTEKVGTKITATVYSKKGVLPPAQKTTKTRRRA